MSAFLRFTPLTSALPSTVPFVGPEALERQYGLTVRARIGANENGFGPAPSVIAAMRREAADIWKYNDPENFALKQALAAHLGVKRANVCVGEGVDALLGLIVRLIVEPGTTVVTSYGGYPTFNFHVVGYGGRLVTVPYVDDREDLDGLLDAVKRDDASLVYLANPDNPMGSWWDADRIVAFARALPETCMLVLDEAYSETAPKSSVPDIQTLIGLPNVLRTRTFSKAYGLAGARVGYVVGVAETIQAFDKVRNHFGMNRLATVAALAALEDQNYLSKVVADIHAARDRIGVISRDNGLSPLASATNFVAIDCGRDGIFERSIVDGLIEHGVFVRMPGVAPLNRCIRVSVGPKADLDLFAEALPKVLKSLR
jgi:histidinol-phosphate aminotransferase